MVWGYFATAGHDQLINTECTINSAAPEGVCVLESQESSQSKSLDTVGPLKQAVHARIFSRISQAKVRSGANFPQTNVRDW